MRLNVVFEKRRDKYARMPPTALPERVAKILAKSVEGGRTLRVRRHTTTILEVKLPKERANGRRLTWTMVLARAASTGSSKSLADTWALLFSR